MLAAIENADEPTSLVGFSALGQLRGAEAVQRLVEAYPTLTTRMRSGLVPVLAAKRHKSIAGILKSASESEDPVLRNAGLDALEAIEAERRENRP
jgi:hypothetical protein